MPQVLAKSADRLTVDRDTVLRLNRPEGGCGHPAAELPDDVSARGEQQQRADEEVRAVLRDMTEEILAQFSELDAASSQEMLSQFVSDLFLGLAQKRQREERQMKQAEGITAARERGVQFGRSRKPLPENFEEYRAAWRSGRMSLREAANACGMSHSTFRNAVMRMEHRDTQAG